MNDTMIHPEYLALQRQYEELTQRLTVLVCTYDEMVLHEGKNLEAEYIREFGELDRVAYAAYVEAESLRRQIDLVQAYLNRDVEPDLEAIEQTLQKEFEEYQKKLQEMADQMAWAQAMAKAPRLSIEETKQIKKLYHKLAKALHPDINPAQTDADAGLWISVAHAYENADLEQMETLYELFESQRKIAPPVPGVDPFQELQKKCEKIKKKVQRCLEKICKLEKEYPFKFKELMLDPEEIAYRKNYLRTAAKMYGEEAQRLRIRLEMMRAPQSTVLH